VLVEAEPEQIHGSDSKQTHSAFAYATPYSWNPAADSRGKKDGHPEFDSGDTDPLTSSPSAGSESNEADTLNDEDEDNNVDDDGGMASDDSVHGTGHAQLAKISVPYDIDSERARRPARLLSPLTPNPSLGRPFSRAGGRHCAEHPENRDAASQADSSSLPLLEDEHGHASEDESMDEDDIVDEDDAIMEDEADNDNDDDSDDNDDNDNDEMV